MSDCQSFQVEAGPQQDSPDLVQHVDKGSGGDRDSGLEISTPVGTDAEKRLPTVETPPQHTGEITSKTLDDSGSSSAKTPDDSGSSSAKTPDDSGSSSAKTPDDSGSSSAKTPDDSGSSSAKTPDDSGSSSAKTPDDSGSSSATPSPHSPHSSSEFSNDSDGIRNGQSKNYKMSSQEKRKKKSQEECKYQSCYNRDSALLVRHAIVSLIFSPIKQFHYYIILCS